MDYVNKLIKGGNGQGPVGQYQHVEDPFPGVPNGQQQEQIQPRQRRGGMGQGLNEIENFLSDKSSLQESVFVDQHNPEAQQINSGQNYPSLGMIDSGAGNQGRARGEVMYTCRCGQQFMKGQEQELLNHQNCPVMQQDGFANFIQLLQRLGFTSADPPPYHRLSHEEKAKVDSARALFDILVPAPGAPGGRAVQPMEASAFVKDNHNMHEEEKVPADGFGMQIDSSSNPIVGGQVPEENQMDFFMNAQERGRAQTYYKQLQRDMEEKCCKFCDKQITESEMQENNCTMLQTTECFHQVHVDCLKQVAIKLLSENERVNCPRCGVPISDYELKLHLSDEELAEIEKNQTMQIVKQNPSFVACQCGNIMEMVPGDIVRGQKDDKGNPLSAEAARHMAHHRIRCPECQKNFCTACNAEPYHTGKTCEQNEAKGCRFCGEELKQPSPSMKQAFRDVCRKSACFELMQKSCDKMLPCGHPCGGTAGEKRCLPCLEPECIEKMPAETRLKQNKDDFCSICYVSGVGQEPSVLLKCGHVFHLACICDQVKARWNGPRIVFNYLCCPECKAPIESDNPQLNAVLVKEKKLQDQVVKKAMERAKFEDLHKHARLKDPKDVYFNDLKAFALYKLSYYQCFKCSDAYFGGMKDCEQGANAAVDYKKEDLVCGKCAAVSVGGGVKNCAKHGTDFIEFKCKFCCSIAQWFCWGNTHFCEPCHKKQCSGDYVSRKKREELPQCPGKSKCPLKIDHPPNGEEYALGCSVCRNLSENAKNF